MINRNQTPRYLLLLLIAAVFVGVLFASDRRESTEPLPVRSEAIREIPLSTSAVDAFLPTEQTTASPVSRDVEGESGRDDRPAVVIVMDDCGYSLPYAKRVKSLDLNITWAILPNAPYAQRTADLLREDGTPFLIHLPMQAEVDPDGRAGEKNQYVVGVGMRDEEIRAALLPILDAYPDAFGVNNHRGSKATSDPSTMEFVLRVLGERKLFFLDSNTSSKTVAYRTAKEMGLRTAKNAHFLDNEADLSKIEAQFERAVNVATKNGVTIAICHLRPETILFLEKLSTEALRERGVTLLTLPQFVGRTREEKTE